MSGQENLITNDLLTDIKEYQAKWEERRIKLKIFAEVFFKDKNKRNFNSLIYDFYDSVGMYFHFSTGGRKLGKSAFTSLILRYLDSPETINNPKELIEIVKKLQSELNDKWAEVTYAYARARIELLKK